VSDQVFFKELEYIADDSDFYALCERIRFRIAQAGLDFTQACLLEGIHTDIVAAWIKELKTDNPRPELKELKDRADKARIELESQMIEDIMKDSNARTKLDLLEKLFPEKYGKKADKIEHDGGLTIKVELPDKLKLFGE